MAAFLERMLDYDAPIKDEEEESETEPIKALEGVDSFNLRVEAGNLKRIYRYKDENKTEAYVLIENETETGLLLEQEAIESMMEAIEEIFDYDELFDPVVMSQLLLEKIHSDSQEGFVTLSYHTNQLSVTADVYVHPDRPTITFAYENDTLVIKYSQSINEAGVNTILFSLIDRNHLKGVGK
jgi:hypothetical protein